MKWFKHYCDMADDEFIAELIEKFDWYGYGVWCRLLEIIGHQMKNKTTFGVTYSRFQWALKFNKTQKGFPKITRILLFIESKQKINIIEHPNDRLEIQCRKLLDISDEWTTRKNKQHRNTQESLVSESGVTTKSIDKEEEVDKEHPPNPPQGGCPTGNKNSLVRLTPNQDIPYPLFPIIGGKEAYNLSQDKIDEYRETYPNIDVDVECRKAWNWIIDNPENRKKKYPAYLTRWLTKASDKKGNDDARRFQNNQPSNVKTLRPQAGIERKKQQL